MGKDVISFMLGAAVCALALQPIGAAGADNQFQAGLTLFAADVHHREKFGENIATALIPVPTIDLSYRHRRAQLFIEMIPPVGQIPLSSGGYGIRSISAEYADGTARYYSANGRFGVGAGEMLWNQRTKYEDSATVTEYDASRGVGARYEALASLPSGNGTWDARIAATPRVNAVLSWVYTPATLSHVPVDEQGALTDIAFGRSTHHEKGDFYAGVRWVNLTAKTGGGGFLDANWLAGIEVRYLWNALR